jgi:hypothetical protein
MSEDKKKPRYSSGFLTKHKLGGREKVRITDYDHSNLPTRKEAKKIAQRQIDKLYDTLEYWEEFSQMKRFAQVQELEQALNNAEMDKASIISEILLHDAHWGKNAG